MSKSANRTRPRLDESIVLVAGDVFVDHHIYEGERTTAASYSQRGVKVVREHGGAYSLYKLIESVRLLESPGDETRVKWQARFALDLPELNSEPSTNHALATWKPFLRDLSSRDKVWRASLLMGYGHDDHSPANDVAQDRPTYAPGQPWMLVVEYSFSMTPGLCFVTRRLRNVGCCLRSATHNLNWSFSR